MRGPEPHRGADDLHPGHCTLARDSNSDLQLSVDRGAEYPAIFAAVGYFAEVANAKVDVEQVESLMASPNPDDEPADVFVEETVQRLLTLVGLPSPEEFPG